MELDARFLVSFAAPLVRPKLYARSTYYSLKIRDNSTVMFIFQESKYYKLQQVIQNITDKVNIDGVVTREKFNTNEIL